MKQKNVRNLKVYEQSGYRYRSTPTIMLKGQWLQELGFNPGDYISIACENGKLVITPDVERAQAKAAEEAFLAKEMKALQKRYEAEKANIRAQMVAEPGVRWRRCSPKQNFKQSTGITSRYWLPIPMM